MIQRLDRNINDDEELMGIVKFCLSVDY